MNYKDIDDGELYMLVCEDDENAKEILFNKYKYIIDLTNDCKGRCKYAIK